jgi:hypothetical protein
MTIGQMTIFIGRRIVKKQIKLITCKALKHILEPLLDIQIEKVILEIGLHLNPDRLRDRLIEEVAMIEGEDVDIILGYGLCGRALEGVFSMKSRLILPRVDDCVGAILGSRKNHQKVLADHPGSYFLDPEWVDTELDIFAQCQKGLERIPVTRRPEIIKLVLKHYSKLAFLGEKQIAGRRGCQCQKLAANHDLNFITIKPDLSLLKSLVDGFWSEKDFIILPPGEEIPFF